MWGTSRVACLSAMLALCSVAAATAHAQGSIERGRYLVEGILTCGNCHSPRRPGGVVNSARLYSGGPQTWDEPAFTVKGSNITPDPDTGIGKWSSAELRQAISEGVPSERLASGACHALSLL